MRGLFVIWCVLGLCLLADAQDSTVYEDTPDSINRLKPVQVLTSASSFQNKTLSIDENEAVSLHEFLVKRSSASIKSNGAAGLGTVSLGGLAGNHTALLWEGVNLQNIMNGFSDLRTIPTFLFSEVNIYEGAMAAPGGGGLGGSIELGSGKSNNALFYQTGSFGQHLGGVRFGKKHKNFQARIGFFGEQIDNNFTYSKPGFGETQLDHARFQQWHLAPSISYAGKKSSFSVNSWISQASRLLPPTLFQPISVGSQQDENIRIAANYVRRKGKNVRYRLQGVVVDDVIRFNDSLINVNSYNHSQLYKALGEVEIDRKKVSSPLRAKLPISTKTHFGLSTTYMRAVAFGYKDPISLPRMAIFVGQRYSLENGARLNWKVRAEAFNNLLPVTGQVDFLIPLRKRLQFLGNMGRAYRYPTLNDLYWKPGGNSDLLPESALKASGRLRHISTFKQAVNKLEIGFGSNWVTNWIAWIPEGGYSVAKNYKQVWANNIEVANTLSRVKKHSQQLQIIYSYTSSSIRSGGIKGSQVPYIPLHQLKTLGFYKWKVWALNASYTYLGYRYTLDDNSHWLPGFGLFDINIGRNINIKKLNFQFRFTANNILNTTYTLSDAYPMPGRNYSLSLLIKN